MYYYWYAGLWGSSLRRFVVYLNKISGTLPPSYSTWTNLEFFLINNNFIEGIHNIF